MSSYFDEDNEIYSDDENVEEEEDEYETNESITRGNLKKKSIISNDDDEEDEDGEVEGDVDEIEQHGGDDENDDEELDENDNEDLDEDDEDLDNNEIDDDEELDDDDKEEEDKQKKIKQLPQNVVYNDDDDDDDDGETYLKKFDKDIHKNYIMNFHPECVMHNYDEIEGLSKVVRDQNGVIIDDLHRTLPYLTKYERTRVLGQRAKQINSGATPFVKVPENVIDGYLVAELELKQKRIPFIIRRPLPNGGSEYWNIKDLENIAF